MSNKNKDHVNPFEAQFDEAESKGATQTLIPEDVKLEPGDKLTGLLTAFNSCEGEGGKSYQRYTFDIGGKLVSIAPGAQVDRVLANTANLEKVCRLTFLGIEKLKGGRSMNRYDVRILK